MITVITEVRGAYTYVESSYSNIIRVGNEVLNSNVTEEIAIQENIINNYI
jgi:hypothetical protein